MLEAFPNGKPVHQLLKLHLQAQLVPLLLQFQFLVHFQLQEKSKEKIQSHLNQSLQCHMDKELESLEFGKVMRN
jgi:hypothetical protein